MTINSISSTNAATQTTPTARHKPGVDFAKLMVNAGDIKPDAVAQQQGTSAVTPAQNPGGINTTA